MYVAPLLMLVVLGSADVPEAAPIAAPPAAAAVENPAIDMPGFLGTAREAAAHRAGRRVSEAEFLRMAAEPGTIVLDARSAASFARLHVRGAINLSFPDIAVDSLQATIPDRGTRLLIYCNNNFTGAPAAFPTKLPSASLNLSTFVALYDYGYRNVYELAPKLDVATTTLPLEGPDALAPKPAPAPLATN